MPRRAKPFFFQGAWYTNAGGKRTKLAVGKENREAAEDALLDYLQRIRANREQAKTYPELSLKDLVNQFLDYIELNRSRDTYLDYRFSLKGFVKLHEKRRARELAFLDGENFKRELIRQGKKPCTVNHFIVALNVCFNWGVRRAKLVPDNPFRDLEKLPSEGRKRTVTDEEFRAFLRACTDALFRQVLLVLRFTGVRPIELRQLTWDAVDWENRRLIITHHKAARTAKQAFKKHVHLPDFICKLLRWRKTRFGDSRYVFLNTEGQQWTKGAFRQRMEHLRRRAGIKPDENGETLVLYSNRHTYLTAAARAGANSPQLQKLGGWTSLRMAQKYIHLDDQDVSEGGAKAVENLRRGRQKSE